MAEMITLRAYLDELGRMLEQEAPTEVISHCRYILQHFPQNVETYRLLGKALLQKGHQEHLDEHFTEAAEVFRRVLAAVPNDYVAHLGLSETHDRNEELDRAIWHLERAYEQMPGNAALQDALRELYVKRDGEEHAPARIQLTRGALARQYMNGQLYDQAAAELQAALAQDAERVDLQVMLAEALWSGWHEVEAGEMAVRVLKRLPNCLAANRILAQLWLDNERPTDARPFLDRVEALDPYVAAYILQPGAENASYVELERLDYYRQSQTELLTETPSWVHDLDAELDAGDLWAAPPQAARPAEGTAPPGPDHIDMTALFGAEAAFEQAGVEELADWRNAPPPDWFAAPTAAQRAGGSAEEAVPDFFAEAATGESEGAAIEADWLFEEELTLPEDAAPETPAPTPQEVELPGELDVWDELRAAAGDSDELTLPEAILPEADSPGEQADSEDLFATIGIFDADWAETTDDEVFSAPLSEADQQPADFPFVWESEPAPSAEAGPDEEPVVQREETPDQPPFEESALAHADPMDQPAEAPDFEQIGEDDLDWAAFQDALEAEAPRSPEEESAPAAPPMAEITQFVTSDELRFLDELPLAGGGVEPDESERLRDEIDAAFQDFLSFDEVPAAGQKDAEAISAPEWLPAWDVGLAGDEGEIPASAPEAAESGEPAMSAPDDTLVSERPPLAEMPAEQEERDRAEFGDAMSWLEDSLDGADVADADFLAAIAAASGADLVSGDEEGEAQLATDLPAWIQEAAPLSERTVMADEKGLTLEEEQALEALTSDEPLGELEDGVADQGAALLAEWETWGTAQESAALIDEGAGLLEAEAGEADWLGLPEPEESAPVSAEMLAGKLVDKTKLLDETIALEAASLAEAERQDAADHAGPGEPGDQAVEETGPAWLEGLAGSEEKAIPAEDALDDLAALLTQPYDPFEGGSPDKVPQYASAHDTGILQPDEQPDWMAAFTGEEVAPDLSEEVGALLSGEPGLADDRALVGALDVEGGVRADTFVFEADSGDERGEPLPARETDFPFDLDAPAEEGEVPSWLLAIADSEADKLGEEFADEGIAEAQEAALDAQDLDEADLIAPEPPEAVADVDITDEWDAVEELLSGDAEAEIVLVASEDVLADEEPVAAEDEWSFPLVAAETGEPADVLPEEYEDEPVPEDFSFGDWLPIWLRKPLEGGLDSSLGVSRDEKSEPPEWLRDVNEDEQ